MSRQAMRRIWVPTRFSTPEDHSGHSDGPSWVERTVSSSVANFLLLTVLRWSVWALLPSLVPVRFRTRRRRMTLSHHRRYRLILNSGSSACVRIFARFRCRPLGVNESGVQTAAGASPVFPRRFWHRLRLCPCPRLPGTRCACLG